MNTVFQVDTSSLILRYWPHREFPEKGCANLFYRYFLYQMTRSQSLLSSDEENEIPKYTRGIYIEDGRECEDVFPTNWIQDDERTLRWPLEKKQAVLQYMVRQCVKPEDNWLRIRYKRHKLQSNELQVCKDYEFTDTESKNEGNQILISILYLSGVTFSYSGAIQTISYANMCAFRRL